MAVMTGSLVLLSIAALLAYPLIRRLHSIAFLIVALVPAAILVWLLFSGPSVLSGVVHSETISWIPQLDVNLSFRLDAVAYLFALLVTGAGALVLFYCRSYFEDTEDGLARFGSSFLGFATCMLGLVFADNVYLLFLFWEGTTVFSFLLIGHAARQRTARSAALQALIVTTFGGLAMLVGLVLLSNVVGSPLLSDIIAAAPRGPLVTVAVFLVLLGALSKSAIFPFHFWLPGAMAAPTPVSAYLHAAAMVKAGIYLIARLGPGFGDVPGYREVLVILGAITMLNGGYRALRQFDIKLIVAHGTVSQLGLLVMVFGLADARTEVVGFALLFAHALAKAPLFLAVGIVDHRTGTRDLRKLSGVGRAFPVLATMTILAAGSMAGFPPMLGFVSKEAGFGELLALGPFGAEGPGAGAPSDAGQLLALIAFLAMVVGSILTVAYMGRFIWGVFFNKAGVEDCAPRRRDSAEVLVAPGIFVALTLLGGLAAPLVDPWLQATGAVRASVAASPEHLALWHGFTPALGVSMGVLILGLVLAVLSSRTKLRSAGVPERFSASHAYWVITHAVDVLAVRLTALTQRGSLPFYLAVILFTTICTLGGTLLATAQVPENLSLFSRPAQIPIAVIMIIALIFGLRARTRFQAVVLIGVTGYGMATIFALHGAPDLALTQALVETVTLITFVLVIRRLPQHIKVRSTRPVRWIRAAIAIGVAAVIAGAAVVALDARMADPISKLLPELAYAGGHGKNIVNVMLVDIRGWDTLGELSVVLAAATGVASLVFVSTRIDNLPKLSRRDARTRVRDHMRRVEDPNDPTQRLTWMLAGRNLNPTRRSIILEVVVRLIFHALILLSFYLLLTGHNTPGGGFSAGLIAGLALVARYLTGGREELGATVPVDAGKILGAGLALAAAVAILPLFFGQSALASMWIDVNLGPLGTIPIVTSTLFDIGVYLVVFGLILDVLRSLGAEIDQQEEKDLEVNGQQENYGFRRKGQVEQ